MFFLCKIRTAKDSQLYTGKVFRGFSQIIEYRQSQNAGQSGYRAHKQMLTQTKLAHLFKLNKSIAHPHVARNVILKFHSVFVTIRLFLNILKSRHFF